MLVEINFSTSPVTVIIVIIIFLGRVFRRRRKVENGMSSDFFFSFSSPTKEFLNVGCVKMFYVNYRGMRFFFLWLEKNSNKTFSSLLLINVTNKIWKLKIFVWETFFTWGGIINDVMRTIRRKWGSIFQKNGKCTRFYYWWYKF